MSKDFKKKYMHPTRRKLVDMVHTGKYEKNATIGYQGKKETRKVGDVWEDEHHRYEKKDGFIVKTGKNSEQFQEIRKYLEEKTKCKNSECKTIKITKKDKTFIEKGGYCMNCTIDREHEIRVAGVWEEYQNYKYFLSLSKYEGNSKAILEAMSSGCIVIASKIRNNIELIDQLENGVLFDMESDNLLKVIKKLDGDIDLQEKIFKNAIKKVKLRNSLNVIASKEYNIFEILNKC